MSGVTPFDQAWEGIVEHAGEFFRTQAGEWFTYRVEENRVLPSHSDARIPQADFERVFPMLPLVSPQKIGRFVTGAKWIYAILHDERIRRGRW